MRKIATIVAIAALVFASLSVLSPPIATAVVPPATGNNAVITVKVGSDRSGTSAVTNLAGVVLGFYDAATGGTAAFTCTSDADGDCSITVPNTQPSGQGGVNRDRRFFVRQISAPPGYYMNSTLAVGTTVASTAYTFETGNQLRAGNTYSSSVNFMIDTGNGNNVASGGIWQDSRNNPVLPPQCGLHVAIVADLSNSVTASDLVALKGAATTFVNSLTGTPSTVSLFTFGTDSPAAGAANVNRPGLLPVSTAAGAATVNGFINGWTLPGGAAGGTNWDQAFAAVAQESQKYDLVAVITDGNPTYYGNPTQGPGNRTRFREVENGIFSANAVKAEGTRMVAVGVGSGVSGAPDNLKAISGPVANSDFYQTTDYAAAGAALRALALGSCQGTVTVVKQVLPPGTPANSQAGAQPAGGWTFGATATSGVTVNPASGQTANGTGALNFNLTFPGGTTTAPVTVTETQQSGYTLHPVGGFNAVCTRVDTGAALTVTNVGTGFSVPAAQAYPVSCTVYNVAPQPPASVVVTKQWVVNGVTYPQGEQPPELVASLLLAGTAQDWGTPRTGFSAGDVVSINESSSVAASSLCTITTRALTTANGTPVNATLPSNQTLVGGLNSYQITNTATCPARLKLLKNVVNGDATANAWTLTATAPSGALAGPTGTTGVTAPVSPLVTYPLSESAGDPRYVQLTAAGAVAIPGSTISWFCNQVDPTTGAVIPGFSDGLNGGVTIPLGFAVQCEARNQTSPLTLIKHVVNDNGGTAVASDWNLTATPTGPPTPPATLGPQTVSGSETATAANTIFVRPGQPYALTETNLPGYALDSISCVIGDDPTPRAMTTVTLAVGQLGTCTYTNNDQPAHLTLVKTVTNDNGGTAAPTAWTLSAAGPTPISGATGTAAVTNAAVNAGTYTLAESGPSGYTAGAWSCTGATVTGSSLVLGVGVSATCTINNDDQPAHLTLVKDVTNNNGGTAVPADWTLSATGPTSISGPSGSGSVTNAQVNAGTYTLAETGPTGYAAGAWSCNAGTLTGSSLVLPLNTSATCTITNNDEPAHLTLVKTVTNDNGGTAVPTDWTLSASGPTPITGTSGSSTVTDAAVNAGTYTLSESGGPSGYTAGAWSCTGATVTGSSVVLGVGQSATCTINNNDQPAHLTLVKTVTNDNGGTALPTAWTLSATGTATPITGSTGSAAVTNAVVNAGTYTLAESGGPTGYTAGAWSCTGATVTGSSLVLAVGQSATCTINNNDQPAHLTLVKAVDAAESGSDKVPADWTLTATPVGIAGQPPVSGNGDPTSSGGVNNEVVFAGNYDLSESGPTGFDPGVWSCEGGTLVGVRVTVPSGGTVTCTITNTAIAPRLTLVKVVDNADTGATTQPTAWTLTADGPTTITGVTGSSEVTSAAAKVGTYDLSESGPPGYTASNWTCTGGTSSTAGSVTLTEGDNATCTITNTVVAPTLTLIKEVDNGDTGGTAAPTDWTLTAVNGNSTISGPSGSDDVTGATAIVGSYTLSESGGPNGYTASTWTCTGASSTARSVTLGPGDDATCTITNTATAPTLTLVKDVDNGDTNATAVPTDWTLTADGPTTITGESGKPPVTGATAVAGTYDLSESGGPAGYQASDWTCTGASGSTVTSVTLGVGDDATCTITNTVIPPKLTLVKVVDNGDTGATAAPEDWTLTAVNGSSKITGASGSPAVTGATALVGTYDLSESGGPKGYDASAWDCGDTPQTDTTVTLEPGDDVTCTITNTAVLPTLTLVKTVDNGDTGATAKPTDWTLSAVNGTSTITGTSGSTQVTDVPAIVGTYTLSESGGPDGYTASNWTCTGGTASTATSVTLSTADAATCTITNTAIPPTLTLVKTVDNDNTGATNTATDWTLTAAGPIEIKGATGSPGITKAVVEVGAYRLDENGPSGYTASAWTCTGAAETTASTVTVAAGQNATCRITNTAIDSKLTLVKRVQNLHGGTRTASDWTLYASGPAKLSGHTGAAAVTAVPVPMGAYHLNEGGPTGYHASAWTCTNATVTGATVQIGLQQSVICTITNTDVYTGPPATPPLSTTGVAALSWTKTGLLLLLVGGALTFLGRRRNRA